MTKKPRQLTILLATILGFFVAFASFISTPVYADEDSDSIELSGTSLEISPASRRTTLTPGKTEKNSLTLKNNGSDSIDIVVYAKPYSAPTGSASRDYETETEYTQIANWITFKDEEGNYTPTITFTLSPYSAKNIHYAIDVPDTAPTGGQYAVIFMEQKPEELEEDAGVIRTISRIGMSLLANIPGDFVRDTQISDLEFGSILIDKNVAIKFRLTNKGNIDVQAPTFLEVTSIFGKTLYQETLVTTAFPESDQTVYLDWKDTPLVGIYKVKYAIDALDQHLEETRLVFVVPSFILFLLVTLLPLIIIRVRIILKRRKTDKETFIQIN